MARPDGVGAEGLSDLDILYAGSAGLVDAVVTMTRADNETLARIAEMIGCGRSVLVCMKMSPWKSMAEWLGLRRDGGLRAARGALQQRLFRCSNAVAVMPNSDAPRYWFPYRDHASHRFLVRQVLLPRRYALGFRGRMLLRAYAGLLSFRVVHYLAIRHVGIIVTNGNDQ